MIALFPRIALLLLLGTVSTALAETPPASSPPPPVTTRGDPAGKLVNGWFAEGSAAGNRGDHYDNRDGGHSALNLRAFPQFQPVAYTADELAQRRNFGPAAAVLPFPTLGNASLSASADNGGSIPRIIYLAPNGVRLLQTSYLSGNLYVYPEHQDHDPLHGDLYPLNTPYLVISQGSSSSDKPFLEAFALTLAAFPPAVKEELVRSRLLVPTLQFILRSSLKPVRSREDYLSGVAHPAVFPPEWIDAERMVRQAHSMGRATIPPLVQLRLISESPPLRPGVDFFEPPALSSEVLANELSVIGRVFRGLAPERTVRISAAQTADLLGRPLRVHWRLLRGDPALVTIKPTNSGHEAEIRVRYHPQPLPVPGQPSIRSTRVDIGAFVDNGISLSTPAFVSFHFLPSEERVFDEKGRLTQIDYQAPSRHVELPPARSFRWVPLLEAIWKGKSQWPGSVLSAALPDGERAALQSCATKLQPLIASKCQLESQLQGQLDALAKRRAQVQSFQIAAKEKGNPAQAEAERQVRDLQLQEKASQALAASTRNSIAGLEQQWEQHLRISAPPGRPLLELLSGLLERLIHDPNLYPANQARIEEQATARFDQIRQRLLDRCILLSDRDRPGEIASFAPLAKPENHFYLRALNHAILSEVLLPGVLSDPGADELADPRLTIPKPWRDLFAYDSATGQLRGWQRIHKGQITEYDDQGRLLTPQGPVPVTYQIQRGSKLLEVVVPGVAPGSGSSANP